MSKLGFVSEIRIDKKASDDNINKYLKDLGTQGMLKTSLTVDSKAMDGVIKQLQQYSNFNLKFDENGLTQISKSLSLGFKGVANYIDTFNQDTEEWEQSLSVTNNRLKVQEDIYGRLVKLAKEKGRLERESIGMGGDSLSLNLQQQDAIMNKMSNYESFIDKEDLFNLAEYMKLVDQLQENQAKFDSTWAKYSQSEDKKRELELEKQITQQQQEQKQAQKDKEKYLKDYANTYNSLLKDKDIEDKAFKNEQTTEYTKLVELVKQKGTLERQMTTLSKEQLNNAKDEYKVIKDSIKAQEKLIKNNGLQDDGLAQLVEQQKNQNQVLMNRVNAKNKDDLQAQQYDKVIKAYEKWYKIKLKMVDASEDEIPILERQKKIVESVIASSNSRIWNKKNGIRDESLDKVVAQTKEIGDLQLKVATDKKQQNELMETQGKILDELIRDENKLYQLRKDLASVNGVGKEEISNQITDLELKAKNKLNLLQEEGIVNSAKLEQYDRQKVENANKLLVVNAKVKEQQEQQLTQAKELITNSQKSMNVTLQNLMSGKNGDYVDTTRLNELKAKINSLNAINTKEARTEINKLNLEIKELTADANQRRLQTSVDGVYGLQQSFKSLVGYFSGAMIIRELWQQIRVGATYVKELDSTFTDLNITMDITNDGFNGLVDKATQLAKANGIATSSVLQMAKTYANANTTIDEVIDKLKPTVALTNISGMDTKSATSAVQSVLNQFKLVKDAEGDVVEATTKMGDVLTSVSQSMAYDFSSGLSQMIEGINTAGSAMRSAGMDLESYTGMMGKLIEVTGSSGSEVANAMKMIAARTLQIKSLSDEMGVVEEDMGKAEKALSKFNISIRDGNSGALRPLQDILNDLSKSWKTMTDEEKQYTAEMVAGNRQRSYLVTLMENMDDAMTLVNGAYDSQGTLMEANEKYVDSLEGKLGTLKATMEQFYATIINSDAFATGIDVITKFVGAISTLIDKVGVLPLAMGGLTTYVTMFNKQGRLMVTELLNMSSRFVAYNQEMTIHKNNLIEIIAKKQSTIELLRTEITQQNALGVSTSSLSAKLNVMKASLIGTQLQLVWTTIKTIALQAAMSMGLSLAITAVIGGFSKLISWLGDYTNHVANAEKATNNLKESSDGLSKSLGGELTKLLSDFGTISKKIDETNVGSEERNGLLSELSSIKSELVGIDESYSEILDNETLTYEQQLALLKEMRAEKNLEKAEKLDNDWTNYEKQVSSLEWYDSQINKVKSNIEGMKEALNSSQNGVATWGGTTYSTNELNNMLKEQEDRFKELYTVISKYNSDVKLMNDAGYDTERVAIVLGEAFESLLNEILGIKDGVDDMGASFEKAIPKLSELHSLLNDDLGAEQQFVNIGNEIEELVDLLAEINKEGLNFDNMDKVLKIIPEIGANITNVKTVQEALNNKIIDMKDAQTIAYTYMMETSNEYFETTIKNTSQWEQFTLDVNSNLTKVHATMLTNMGVNYEKYFGEIAESYEIDLSNCKNLAEARVLIEAEAAEKIAKMRQAISDASYEHGRGGDGEYHETNETKDYKNAINEITKWKNEALEAINKVANITVPTFDDFKSPSSSSSSSTEKEVEDLKDIADAYYEIENALKDVNNALDLNKAKQENATGKERVELMREEVELLKQKQQLLAQQQSEMEKERDSLRSVLQKNGFQFDNEGNIANYKKRLQELQSWVNGLSGDAKEEAKESVEALIEVIDRYTSLVKDEIPDVIKEFEEMTSAIKDAEREQLEYVTQVQKDITSAIENELKKRTDAIKNELQKQQDLYNAQYEEEDYQDNLSKEKNKLDQLQQQINDLSRDSSEVGKLRLQQLREEYATQQELINNMIRDWEKEQGNNAFDDMVDKVDEDLENALDPQNIADMVNKALLDGFVTIGDEIIELDTLMSDWLNETGDGLLAVGELLRSELLDSLVQAGTLMGNISEQFSRMTGTNNVTLNTRAIPTTSVDASPTINFNSPILTVEGDITEDVASTLSSLMEQVKYEVMSTVSKALNTY